MEIEIIPLARRKMERRGISEKWVRETISFPEQVVEGYGNRKVYQKRYKFLEKQEQLLRVICEETQTRHIVVSAYLTSKIEKYWR